MSDDRQENRSFSSGLGQETRGIYVENQAYTDGNTFKDKDAIYRSNESKYDLSQQTQKPARRVIRFIRSNEFFLEMFYHFISIRYDIFFI